MYEAQGREFKESILYEADIVLKLGDWESGRLAADLDWVPTSCTHMPGEALERSHVEMTCHGTEMQGSL